jgi:hypothetical protein
MINVECRNFQQHGNFFRIQHTSAPRKGSQFVGLPIFGPNEKSNKKLDVTNLKSKRRDVTNLNMEAKGNDESKHLVLTMEILTYLPSTTAQWRPRQLCSRPLWSGGHFPAQVSVDITPLLNNDRRMFGWFYHSKSLTNLLDRLCIVFFFTTRPPHNFIFVNVTLRGYARPDPFPVRLLSRFRCRCVVGVDKPSPLACKCILTS